MQGIVVISHGTVDSLEQLPAFLRNIRRGHEPPPELVAEIARRYEAIGGRSPLNDITREVARKLEARLGVPVRTCGRLFAPYPASALGELASLGVKSVVVLPLAQHSAKIYGDSVREAAAQLGGSIDVAAAGNWGREPALLEAFAGAIDSALEPLTGEQLGATTLVMSAHSLPVAASLAGDPYESEVLASASAVEARLARRPGRVVTCFQSQGQSQRSGPAGRPLEWLGPDLRRILVLAREAGSSRVLVAPVGFLADHVEILYDLDIEARAWAEELGLAFSRTASLNASDALIEALAGVAAPLLSPRSVEGALP